MTAALPFIVSHVGLPGWLPCGPGRVGFITSLKLSPGLFGLPERADGTYFFLSRASASRISAVIGLMALPGTGCEVVVVALVENNGISAA